MDAVCVRRFTLDPEEDPLHRIQALTLCTLSLLLAGPASAAANKVDVCHPAGESGNVLSLNVSANSLGGHLGHGDWLLPTWYADGDGDGYGDAAMAVEDCIAPSGTTSDSSDCDDGDADAYPGAPELCDGLDNDCDGVVPNDELDLDADGVAACEGDCDDADAGIFPGAPETCADGVDNNCDGAVDEDCSNCSGGPADPQIAMSWDAADDFSFVNNPNGPWGYGYASSTTGPVTLWNPGQQFTTGSLQWWGGLGGYRLTTYHNPTSSTIGNCGDWCVAPGQLVLHPEDGSAGRRAVVQFTAPTEGTYDFAAMFSPIDRQMNYIGTSVAAGGALVGTDVLSFYTDSTSFSGQADLCAGDTIVFAVDNGSGSWVNDGTGIEAQVDRLP